MTAVVNSSAIGDVQGQFLCHAHSADVDGASVLSWKRWRVWGRCDRCQNSAAWLVVRGWRIVARKV